MKRNHAIKQSLLCIMLVLLIVILVGCSSNNGSSNSSKVTPAQVIEAIDGIGSYTDVGFGILNKEGKITAADSLYNQLDEKGKSEVTNYDKLVEAKKLLAFKQKKRNEAQTFAEKLFLKLAKQFKYPESISLQHVWYLDLGSWNEDDNPMAYFTFQFDVKNSLGIVENCYYGNYIAFLAMDDEELATFIKGFAFGTHIREGETQAMDSKSAIELDSSKVMSYFRSNR